MICFGFKGGIGTASRKLSAAEGGWTVGVLVQCNFGQRPNLRIAGVPVGEEIADLDPCIANSEPVQPKGAPPACQAKLAPSHVPEEQGSIIVTVATDAPLLPHQLKRIATRVALGIGRQGGFASNGSGDIFVAFSTANPNLWTSASVSSVKMLGNAEMSPLFKATSQATEAAITNALLAAPTMTGANDFRVHGLPHDRVTTIMRKYGRLGKTE